MGRFDTYTGTPTTTNRFNTYGSTTPQVQALRAEEATAKKAAQYANSPLGLAVETIKGIPAAAGGMLKDVGQGIARTVGGVGATVGNLPFQAVGAEAPFVSEIPTTGSPITEAIFGGKPIKTIQKQIEDTQSGVKPYVGETASKFAAPALVAGSIALDLFGMGGAAGKEAKLAIEALSKTFAKERSPQIIEEMLIKTGMEAPKAKALAPRLAVTSSEDDVKAIISNEIKPTTHLVPMNKEVITTSDMADFVVGKKEDFNKLINKESQLEYRISKNAERQPYVPTSLKTGETPTGAEEILARLRAETGFGMSAERQLNRAGINGLPYSKESQLVDKMELAIPREQVDAVSRFIDTIGTHLFDDVGISVWKGGSKSGQYEFTRNLITIYKKNILDSGGKFDRTIIHELWHSLSRHLPSEMVSAVTRQHSKDIANYVKKNPWFGELVDKTDNTIKSTLSKGEYEALIEKFPEVKTMENAFVRHGGAGTGIPENYAFQFNNENYRLKNIDEWFAENLTDKTTEKFSQMDKGSQSIIQYGKNIVRSIIDATKRMFGGDLAGKIRDNFFKGKYEEKVREGTNLRLFNSAADLSRSETKPLFKGVYEKNATPLEIVNKIVPEGLTDLKKKNTPISERIVALDYILTPFNVLKKVGLEESANMLKKAAYGLEKEMPQVMDKILKWSKEITPEGNVRIFQFLDGEKIVLSPEEAKVAGEVRQFLTSLADRLGLPEDKRITDYITHLWPPGSQQEFPEDLLKIISNKVAGSVWDPYLLQRQGAEGYIRDTWGALEAYSKTAVRKIHMDPALEHLKDASKDMHPRTIKYIERHVAGINRRPGEWESLMDDNIKLIFGYRLGVRPTANILSSMRRITSVAKLGGKVSSALQNLTQGVNTFAELGSKYTFIGYRDLMAKGGQELKDVGVLQTSFMEDRTRSAVSNAKQRLDDALFYNFTITEQINRGAAYYGTKARALAMGKTEEEAIQEGIDIAAKTQFKFGAVDTPVALNSEFLKTMAQFQTFTLKQLEYIGSKTKDAVLKKDIEAYKSLARYIAASSVVYGSIGSAFGMSISQVVPFFNIGTPPSFDIVGRTYKNIVGEKDQYGNIPTVSARLRDERKAILTDIVPGGSQIEKTLGGLGAVMAGESRTAPSTKNPKGVFQYKIKQNPMNYVRGTLFGKSQLNEAKKYREKKAGNRFNMFGK